MVSSDIAPLPVRDFAAHAIAFEFGKDSLLRAGDINSFFRVRGNDGYSATVKLHLTSSA
jgi:hypothetical protein